MRAKVENTVVFQKSMFSVLPGQWERARKSFIEEMLPGNPKRKSILGRSNSIRKSSDVRQHDKVRELQKVHYNGNAGYEA